MASWQSCITGVAENILPMVNKTKRLARRVARQLSASLCTSRNNPTPWVRGSIFSARQEWAAHWIFLFPGPSFNLSFRPQLYDDQVIPDNSSFRRLTGVYQPPTGAFPSSLPLPPLPTCQSPLSAPAMAFPEAPPKATPTPFLRPHSWGPYCSFPGPRADQGCTFAYLLAQEEALGGEDCEAVGGRALGRTVGTGCLADFSLLLLAQTKESECGPHRQRPQEPRLF